MGRPRLLDLFCGAGGATRGYQLAGFHVTGVDIKPQPHYIGDEFVQDDALTFPMDGFDAIHASPPCQAYSSATPREHGHPDLYAPTRDRLVASGLPYVIENVIGAPYSHGVVLCGSMFGLTVDGEWIQRHRNFEASWFMFQPPCAHPARRPVTVTGNSYVTEVRTYRHSRQGTYDIARRLMGIDWMSRDELSQSSPPRASATHTRARSTEGWGRVSTSTPSQHPTALRPSAACPSPRTRHTSTPSRPTSHTSSAGTTVGTR